MKAIILSLITAAASAAPEFVGVMTLGQDVMFAVMDSASDTPPKWVRLGQEFHSYQVSEYHSNEDILVLRRNGTETKVKLRDSKVRKSGADFSAAEAYTVAIREVQKREEWAANARFENPQRGRRNWLIPVFRRLADGREECVLVGVDLTSGVVVEYRYLDRPK